MYRAGARDPTFSMQNKKPTGEGGFLNDHLIFAYATFALRRRATKAKPSAPRPIRP